MATENNTQDTFSELRREFDGSDPFMTGGHQIIKERKGSKWFPALWTKDDEKVQALLIRVFPNMKTNSLERQRAGRWVRVIHLFFRLGLSYGQVSDEMGIGVRCVEDTVRSIHRAAAGRQTNNRGPLGQRPEGRPRKTSSGFQTSLGSQLTGSVHVCFTGSPLYRADQSRRRAFRATSA